MIDINWNKLQGVLQNALSTLANVTTQIPGFGVSDHIAALAMTNFGIPLTGSTSAGFVIGFMRG
jgi:hypothetical protein